MRDFFIFASIMEQPSNPTLKISPIGYIQTPFQEKYHAPRQPNAGKENSVGIITLLPNKNFDQALEDLSGFERIWIVYWFHKNSDWKPKVLPPRGGRTKKGVFATRSPHRPNPIGLSLCKLLEVKGRIITVENPDLLDGTPILDIKPYLPYAEAFPDSEVGWLEDIELTSQQFNVTVSEKALMQAQWLKEKFDIHLLERAVEILSFDPFPHSYRRIMNHPNGGYVIAMKSWRVLYSITDVQVTIHEIQSGYPLEIIKSSKEKNQLLHDRDAHELFHHQWSKE